MISIYNPYRWAMSDIKLERLATNHSIEKKEKSDTSKEIIYVTAKAKKIRK